MHIYDLVTKNQLPPETALPLPPGTLCFIQCLAGEVGALQAAFHFDESTLEDCENFDENVRMAGYAGYDFVSLIHFRLADGKIKLGEVNLYVGKNYVVLVMADGDRLARHITERVVNRVKTVPYAPDDMNKLYYAVFDVLLTDLSETMEHVEDEMNHIEKRLADKPDKNHPPMVAQARENVYAMRKQLRPLLYIGDQLLVNENQLIRNENMRFFKNVDIRINKLFDYSNSLQEYANQLSNIYETRLTTQTNEVVRKLTVVTLFFGPPTVIAGIYGMNFSFMPELDWRLGYPLSILMMAVVSFAIYLGLKFKNWL